MNVTALILMFSKKDLFEGKTQATVVDLEMTHEIFVNGAIELDLKLKINDNKGLLSAQILDFGEKKTSARYDSNY